MRANSGSRPHGGLLQGERTKKRRLATGAPFSDGHNTATIAILLSRNATLLYILHLARKLAAIFMYTVSMFLVGISACFSYLEQHFQHFVPPGDFLYLLI